MSRRNREKRAARKKDRRRASTERERAPFGAGADRGTVHDVLVAALESAARCPEHDSEQHAAELLADFGSCGRDIDIAADAVVVQAVQRAWRAGWLPSDVHEIARRRLDAAAAAFVAEAVVVESRRYAPAVVHPRWRAAISAVAAGVAPAAEGPHLHDWSVRNAAGRSAALVVVLQVLDLLGSLPVLERVLPLPGESRHSTAAASGEVDEKALARVRALLAKAESTDFPDEAEALSAKAQELMSRYSLHQAVRDHGRGRAPVASARRLWMDAPYAGAKAHLVQAVATANRCRTVWSEKLGFVTVVGADTDLDLVEVLTTSLLVQASRALLAAGSHVGRGGTSRTRSFRQSFLVAYASRIGERLESASAAGTAAVQEEGALLPVLAARSRAADELTGRLFPTTISRAVPVSNAAGWSAGHAAADLARFDVHAPPRRLRGAPAHPGPSTPAVGAGG